MSLVDLTSKAVKDEVLMRMKEESKGTPPQLVLSFSSPEEKFAKLSPESIMLIAEAAGTVNLSVDVAKAVADDTTYRIRELIHTCGQRVRQSKRRKITVDDINAVLHLWDVECVYGKISPEPPRWTHLKAAGVYIPCEINHRLIPYSLGRIYTKQLGRTYVRAEWLTPDGGHRVPEDMQSLPTDLRVYYIYITKAILKAFKATFKVVLYDLATNKKVAPLLSHLISFIASTLKKLNPNEVLVERMLLLIQVLTRNPALNLGRKPFLNHLVSSVLFCLVKPLSHRAQHYSEKCSVQDCAARTLVQILERWNSPEDSLLRLQTLRTLQGYINDRSKTMMWYHGVLTALKAIGGRAVEDYLYPCLPAFIEYLSAVLRAEETTKQMRYQVQLVYVAMRSAMALSLNHKMKDVFPPPTREPFRPTGIQLEIGGLWTKTPRAHPVEFYQFCWAQFGDSILPFVFLTNYQQGGAKRVEDSKTGAVCPKHLKKGNWDIFTVVGGKLPSKKPVLNIKSAFEGPPLRRPRYFEVKFNFAGSRPVPVNQLKRRRLDPFQTKWSESRMTTLVSRRSILVGKGRALSPTGILSNINCVL